MYINIVTVRSGWILQKIAERISIYNPIKDVNITVTHVPKNDIINYYVDFENCYRRYKTKLDIAYFCHAHGMPGDDKKWLINTMNTFGGWGLDGIMSMNKRYTDMLIDIGYPEEKLITLTPGQTYDMFPLRKIKIGVVSRGTRESYGKDFVPEFFSKYDCSNFEFKFLGNDWEHIIPVAEAHKVSLEVKGDADYSIYPDFYQNIDYLLIPALWTAGPISFQEALSTGTPVISANVGFSGYEFEADYVFQAGNVESLSKILDIIQGPLLKRRSQVESMTWETFIVDLISFIKKMEINK